MLQLLRSLLVPVGFMPHGHCFLWNPGLVFLHLVSDTLIGLAYLSISLTLYALVRRIQLPFSAVILAFGIFIGACGATHFLEVITLWYPTYWLSGAVKAVTAVASVATGILLFPVRSKVVALISSAQLAEERRIRLESQNRELEALYAKVKEAEELKTRFFASVSHELRTPLSLILGPAEKLAAGGTLRGDEQRDLEVIGRNARLLLRHVNDLLDVARLDAKQMGLAYAEVDLADLSRQVASHFAALAFEARVDLVVDAPRPVLAQVDAGKVQRILFNLLSNAFKFTPAGGRVRLSLSAEEDRGVVRVEDSGPGVAEGMRQAIFERFRQSDQEPVRNAQGSGLGLAIVREFAELHGGSVSVGDAPGGGASFRVALPLRAPAGSAVAGQPLPPSGAMEAWLPRPGDERTAQPRPQAPDERPGLPAVLVCEDVPEMRDFVARSLRAEFRVEVAEDGAEGLAKAQALLPDLIVTDLMMPNLSGEGLLAQLRKTPALAETPVLLLSARAEDETRIRLLRSGAQDFLTKPFLAAELLARARNLTAMKQTRDILEGALAASRGELTGLARELAGRKRELETALDSTRVAREQAERASQTKSTFLSLISHELRTPLATLQLTLHGLRRGAEELSDRQREALDKIDRSTRRLLDLIESMLEYTRVESGRLRTAVQTVDAAALARELADEMRPQASARLLELSVDAAADLPPLSTDPRLLRLVLLELLLNAIRHTEKGRVQLAVRLEDFGHCFEVADTGPGIPPEARLRIFEPFQVGAPLEHKHEPGLGLGLSLARQVVEALGGELELSSSTGRGSTFTVRFPSPQAERIPSRLEIV